MSRIQSVLTGLILCILAAPLTGGPIQSGVDQQAANERERELIAILQSDAPDADKAITCKRLAIFGTPESVPALAPLLAHERLASWARIALEAIPGPEADQALREAIDKLDGNLLIGAINSIGVRRDVDAVEQLIVRLEDDSDAVASAAAVALGRIGDVPATAALRRALAGPPEAIRNAIAEGCILSAERLSADGNSEEAVEIYDEVRQAAVPKQRILEATRGAILARQSEGIPLLLEQLRSPDEQLFQIGLSTARELAGREVTRALADEVVRANPAQAALLLFALGDRDDRAVLPVVVGAAESGPKPVRMAAIRVLQQLGDASCVSSLLTIATEDDNELAETAKTTLAELPGAQVDAAISAQLEKASDELLLVLVELVGRRQIDAVTDLMQALDHSDARVRHAALTALGATVGPADLSVLITRVAFPKNTADSPAARQALRAACLRMPDRDACAQQLITASADASTPSKLVFLEILGAMGGQPALQAIGKAARDDEKQLQDAGSRLLGQWMTVDAAPVLLDLAEIPDYQYNIRALRGFIRLARQFNMPDQQRAQMCRSALGAATRSDERKLVLQVLERYPSIDMLKLAIALTEDDELKDEAIRVAMSMSQKLGGEAADAQKLLAQIGYGPVKLDIIKAEYGAGAKQQDVTQMLRRLAGDLPLIVLPSSSYNDSFGGDPAPGTVKQLRIQYRMNDKTGEANFPENAIIFLPLPK